MSTTLEHTKSQSPTAESTITLFDRPDVKQTLIKIKEVQESGVDWEEEAGQPIPDATYHRTVDVVKFTVREAAAQGLKWYKPSVSPTIDGGIHLSWYGNGERAAMTLFSPPAKVQFFGKSNGQASTYECIEDAEAVKRVLHIFLSQSPQAKVG